MKAHALTLILCLAALGLAAQPLSLDSCVALALRNQAAMRVAQLDLESARQTSKAAFTHHFPTVSLSAAAFQADGSLVDIQASKDGSQSGVDFNLDLTLDGQTADGRIEQLQQLIDGFGLNINLDALLQEIANHFDYNATLQMLDHGLTAGATLIWPLYAGGPISRGNELAQLGVDAAQLQLQIATNEVTLGVEQRYWLIASLLEKRNTLSEAQTLLDTLRHDAEAAHAAGVIGRNDLLKVKLRQNELAAQTTQLDNGLQLALMALCQYIGLDYTPTLTPADSLGTHLPTMPLADSTSLATLADRRPEAQLLNLAVSADHLRYRMALGQALPQLAVGATYGLSNTGGTNLNPHGLVFATLNIPLTAWWETSHNARKQHLELEKTAWRNIDLRQQLALQLQQARNQAAEALALVSVRRQAVDDAADNLREVQSYYAAGLATTGELLEAQMLLQQARADLTDQLITYRLRHKTYTLMLQP